MIEEHVRTEIRGVLNQFGLADMGAEDALVELFMTLIVDTCQCGAGLNVREE